MTAPPDLTTFEHQALHIGAGGLTPAEADALAAIGEQRPGFCARGHGSIRLANYCGVVTLGRRSVEILPKLEREATKEDCRGLLLRLLTQAEIRSFKHLRVGQSLRRASLLQAFIAAFIDSVADLLRGGLLRQYQEREEDLHYVRGRILTQRQFSVGFNRPDIVACRYDDLTPDNTWNRALKQGLVLVRRSIRDLQVAQRWSEVFAVFEDVSTAAMSDEELARLVFDRHAVRYRTAIEWVRWIVAALSPSVASGPNSAPGLLFDMNRLFESVIAHVIQNRAEGEGLMVVRQHRGVNLAELRGSQGHDAFELRPDLVVRDSQGRMTIADTKWKLPQVDGNGYVIPSREDVFQMHAYAAAYRCRSLALLYPWHEGLNRSVPTTFELNLAEPVSLRPTLTIACVDLSTDAFVWRLGSEWLSQAPAS